MPSLDTFLLFAGAAFVLIVIPGPAVLFIVSHSLAHGRRAGLASAAGTASGEFLHVVAAALGLSAVVASSTTAFETVKLIGAAYLVLLGIKTLLTRVHGDPIEGDERPTVSHRRSYWRGYRVGALNPKTALFFLAFLPQFVHPERGAVAVQTLLLGTVFCLIAWVSDSSYALVVGTLAERMRRSTAVARTRRWVSGTVMVALGAEAAAS
jgi:threonine/homoserine/homoserine lactone efflux protein